MAVIIGRKSSADNWQLLKPAAPDGIAIAADGGRDRATRHAGASTRETLLARSGGLGRLARQASDDPATIAGDLPRFGLDRRQFSAVHRWPRLLDRAAVARALWLARRTARDRRRAARSAILSFALRVRCVRAAGRRGCASALAAFDDFSEGYQTSVERPQPLFRRRVDGSTLSRRTA